MKIPEVRLQLLEQAKRIGMILELGQVPQIVQDLIKSEIALMRVLEKELWRRKATRKTKPKSAKITPSIRRKIRLLATNTDMSYQDIAVKVGTNMGRVSEVMGGFRT